MTLKTGVMTAENSALHDSILYIYIYIYIYCGNLISCKAALQRLHRKKRYTNKLELHILKYIKIEM